MAEGEDDADKSRQPMLQQPEEPSESVAVPVQAELREGQQPVLQARDGRLEVASSGQGSDDLSAAGGAGSASLARHRQRWPSFLLPYHRAVRWCIVAEYCCAICIAIMTGALFDAYLFIRGGSNSFVGAVESIRGLVVLGCALPMGWLADNYPKPLVLRGNVVAGAATIVIFTLGLVFHVIPIIVTGAVLLGVFNQCNYALVPALTADLTPAGDLRNRAMGVRMAFVNLGLASGSAAQLLLILMAGGGNWTAEELQWFLCLGAPFFCFAAYLLWRGQGSAPELLRSVSGRGGRVDGGMLELAGAPPVSKLQWTVAFLMETTSVITAVGSGMTFKYWGLFFKGDFGFSPAGVCAVQMGTFLSIAGSSLLAPKLARQIGQQGAMISFHFVGTAMLLFISRDASMSAGVTVIFVLVRNAIMNSTQPLTTALLLDLVPQKHRGKWSSFASLRRLTWSGSALVGGLLSDSNDYRFAFFITACVHLFSGCILVVASLLYFRLPASQSQQRGVRLAERLPSGAGATAEPPSAAAARARM